MRRVQLLTICLIFFFAISCEEKAKPIIEEQKMVNILIDVHFAEAAVQHLVGIRKDTTLKKYYKQIMEIHGITQVEFDSAYKLASENPEYIKRVYTQIQDSIQVRSLEATR